MNFKMTQEGPAGEDKVLLSGTSGKRVIFFKHIRLLFNRASRSNQSPGPLSPRERARVREALKG